jgi:hypothetical protein
MDDDLGGIAGGSRRGKSLGEADFGANIAVSKEVEEHGGVGGGGGDMGSGAYICVIIESAV